MADPQGTSWLYRNSPRRPVLLGDEGIACRASELGRAQRVRKPVPYGTAPVPHARRLGKPWRVPAAPRLASREEVGVSPAEQRRPLPGQARRRILTSTRPVRVSSATFSLSVEKRSLPMTAMSGPHHDARAASAKDPTGWLQAGPAGAAVLAEQLQTAVVEMSKWMHEFGEFTPASFPCRG